MEFNYKKQRLRLKIHDYLHLVATRQITALNTLFPDLIRLPPKLDTLGIRLWFALLEHICWDLIYLMVSHQMKLYYLQERGIERYTDEITKIYLDRDGTLTGKIGILQYHHLKGKKLLNHKDLAGSWEYIIPKISILLSPKIITLFSQEPT